MIDQSATILLLDACVLIDFANSDLSILSLMANSVAPVYVISSVLDEVKQIKSEDELINLGVIVIEPEIEDALSYTPGAISFEDHLCLLTAKRKGMICVTNDKRLRLECGQQGVDVLWGLELLQLLYQSGGIAKRKAVQTATLIHQNNPTHITGEILQRFIERITSA